MSVDSSIDDALATAAFSGPRCEARLVGVVMPMASIDLSAAYAASFSALSLTKYAVAESFQWTDATAEFDELLQSEDLLERLLDREVWRFFGPTIVTLASSDGAVLPVSVEWSRARHGNTVAPVTFPSDLNLPLHWTQVALSKLKGGSFTISSVRRPLPGPPPADLAPYRLLDGTTIDLRVADLGLELRRCRDRVTTSSTKLAAQVDSFGLSARFDQKVQDRAVVLNATGRFGEVLSTKTKRPEYRAADTNLLLAGAVSAGTSAVIGLTEYLLNALGVSVAHIATDALVVPCSEEGGQWHCPGGPEALPNGDAAIRLCSTGELRAVMARLDPLFGYDGNPAYKEVTGSLAIPTMGIVFGTNKVVLTQLGDSGSSVLVRSTDTGFGELLDPTGSQAKTEDGRLSWAAELEDHLFHAACASPPTSAMSLPEDLPTWTGRLALRTGVAKSWRELLHLRRYVGDPTLPAMTRFVQVETGGRQGAPIALGHHLDPDTWSTLDFRLDGESVCVEVLGADGTPTYAAGKRSATRHVIARTVGDHVARWLRESDPSMTGPPRGLRQPTPITTHAALACYVGRSSAELEPEAENATLHFDSPLGWLQLRTEARAIGAPRIERLGGPPRRTTADALSGQSVPSATAIAAIAEAVSRVEIRRCAECNTKVHGRVTKTYCDARCRVRANRARKIADREATVEALTRPGGPKPASRTWEPRSTAGVTRAIRRMEVSR